MIGRFLAAALFLGFAALATPAHAQIRPRARRPWSNSTPARAAPSARARTGSSACSRARKACWRSPSRCRSGIISAGATPSPIRNSPIASAPIRATLRVRGRYTPQLVINGGAAMSASYWDEARASLDQAEQTPLTWTPSISITQLRYSRVRVALGTGPRRAEPADVWLAVYDPGPVTEYVTRGVNINRRVYHYNLVRSMDRLGAMGRQRRLFRVFALHSRVRGSHPGAKRRSHSRRSLHATQELITRRPG